MLYIIQHIHETYFTKQYIFCVYRYVGKVYLCTVYIYLSKNTYVLLYVPIFHKKQRLSNSPKVIQLRNGMDKS